MTTLCNISFYFDGPRVDSYSAIYKRLISNLYIKAYRMFAELVNPLFKKWNSEYDGPLDGLDDNGNVNLDSQYNRYIIAKETALVEKNLNPLLRNSKMIKRYFIGEECDFRMELLDGTIVSMNMEPVSL